MASKKLTPGHNHGLPGTLATTFGRLPIGNYLSRRILRLEHSVANTKRGKETIVSALCDFLVARVVSSRKFFLQAGLIQINIFAFMNYAGKHRLKTLTKR